MNLKKIGKIFKSKFVGTGPSSYEKSIYLAAVLTKFEKHWNSRHTTDLIVRTLLLKSLGWSRKTSSPLNRHYVSN